MTRLHSMTTRLVAVLAATASVASMTSFPARAATATFPKVADCSSFTSFYRHWRRVPHPIQRTGTDWVPQGLAYDPARHWMLTSYYDGTEGVAAADKKESMLVVTTLRGDLIKTVRLNTADVDRGGHAGGLAVGRGRLYVASTEHGPRVTGIDLRDVARTRNGGSLPDSPSYDMAAASYASFQDGRLYVGDFEHDTMYSYAVSRTGAPVPATRQSYSTPTLVQGVAVTGCSFVFSRSYGRTRMSYLTTQDRRTGATRDVGLPNMAEGITWAPGSGRSAPTDLYVLFESGSAAYGEGSAGGAATCVTTHLWHRSRTAVVGSHG